MINKINTESLLLYIAIHLMFIGSLIYGRNDMVLKFMNEMNKQIKIVIIYSITLILFQTKDYRLSCYIFFKVLGRHTLLNHYRHSL